MARSLRTFSVLILFWQDNISLPDGRSNNCEKIRRVAGQDWFPTKVNDYWRGTSTVDTDYPTVRRQGCYFHFTQAVFRHIAEFRLKIGYREIAAVKSIFRIVMSSAYLSR